ncbi:MULTISPECIES: CBS domain-containing protein [Methylobacillus]|uniref:Putative signal-transduction protein with CBS domains n=1 Tax=Methylobacillus flagellatus (strain ATCC 51484 / DSM 6875 / VKM B-1610 / KT) TaxID=265072 RepID=Q1GYR0_METFK|nr:MULTISPECIES: CBS domain-containing protein [Methylobacillus]ABE50627.1 putative signal-transduction protein with CBS domains [Methylobacillus flagellatus KT]MPS47772.1 CBS domain-containing protein [Methylobacillus sp.]
MKTVRQVLETKGSTVYSVAPESLVYDALLLMAEHHIGALVVMQRDKMVGIFSERDYAREVVIKGKTSKTTTVGDIMSVQLITVSPDDTVEHCMNLMSGKRIRHLPVLEGEKLVGLLSIGDLVKETIAYQEFLIKQLESYIQS